MCLTVPAKILEIKEDGAIAGKGEKKVEVKISLIRDIKVGDWVLLHANLALKKISKEEAEEIINLYAQYEK